MQLILIAILTNIYYTIQYNSEYRATYTFHGKTATRLAAISQKGVTSPHGGELSVTTIFVFHFFHHYFFRMLILHFFVGGSQCYYLVYIFEFCGDRYCFFFVDQHLFGVDQHIFVGDHYKFVADV